MENLFRFLLMRPPEKVPSEKGIPLKQDTDFQGQLKTASVSAEPRSLVKGAASDFVNTSDYVDDISKLTPGQALLDLARIMREPGEMSMNEMKSAVEDTLGSPAKTIVRNDLYIKCCGGQLCDRQAYSIDGNRALGNEVRTELGREGNREPFPLPCSFDTQDFPHAIDVAGDEMAAKRRG